MARFSKTLAQGNLATRHLGFGMLALCFPMRRVQKIIRDCGKASSRIRDLPAEVVAFYVIALSLFPGVSYQSVLEWLITGLQWLGDGQFRVNTKGALSRARKRLGEEPLKRIHEKLASPVNDQTLPGCRWNNLHLVAIDGTTLALQDTPENSRAFGRSSNQHGAGAWPLARFVALAEVGTHIVFASELGGYRDSETVLAAKILSRLRPGMLCLADRLFPGYDLWQQAAATGAHLLWRAKIGLSLKRVGELSDGSWLAEWRPSEAKAGDARKQLVRVVEYKLKEPDLPASEETYRLITTMLDEKEAEARELAELYPERWEIELTIKEGKSVLRKGQVTLRSKTPGLVRQEFWGLLLAHYLVRRMMADAASGRRVDPDTLSYQRSVEIIKSAQTCPTLAMPAKARNASMAKAMERIGAAKAASSRGMSKERTIKKKPKCDFPVRKSGPKPVTKKREAKVEIKNSAK
ncbi:MAG: IS4 family transposase [Deltaproteobacteria bacterium]